MSNMQRVIGHLFAKPVAVMFPAESLARIAERIRASEALHRGEICFAVEADMPLREVLSGVPARARALGAFGQLGVWNTAANNGVLVYLQIADRRIEIIADRGFEGLVSDERWRGVCQLMEERLAAREPEDAVLAGIDAITALLVQHFPQRPGDIDVDELPNDVVILR